MFGAVRIAFYFDLCQTILQQVDIFLHEFLKYWLLFKIGPGTVGDIDYVWHINVSFFGVCSRKRGECQGFDSEDFKYGCLRLAKQTIKCIVRLLWANPDTRLLARVCGPCNLNISATMGHLE
jgi:hypothetical protein